MGLPNFVGQAGIVQDAFSGRGLAGIDVGNYAYVS
jgi:hypothetical protein